MVEEIESVLHEFGGQQQKPNRIGTIVVATTANGLRSIASLPSVSAVLENLPSAKLSEDHRGQLQHKE